MSTSRLPHWFVLLAIPALAFAASLPVAEVTFRSLGDDPAGALEGLYEQFGNGNYKHAAGVVTDASWSTGRFSVVTDDLGLRSDRARKHATRPGQDVRLLVLGDSQGYGQGVEYEDSLVGALAEIAASHDVTVSNASVGGHYLANQYELVRWLRERHGLRQTRFILLLTPYLIESAGERNSAMVGEDGRLYGARPDSWQRAMVWVKTHTVLYTRVRDALRTVGITPSADRSASALDMFPAGPAATAAERKLLESVRSFVLSEGLTKHDLWVVYAPLATELDFEPLQRAAAARRVQVDPNSPARIASSVAAALELPFVDLRSTLARLRSDGVRLSLTGDPHYSAPSSSACAAAIWAAVRPAFDQSGAR